MMMGLYFAMGVFLLIAVRNPSAHRSLIAFAVWSSFSHAAVMSALGFKIASERSGFLVGSAVLVVIGVALIQLAPEKQSEERPHSFYKLLQDRHITPLKSPMPGVLHRKLLKNGLNALIDKPKSSKIIC